MDVKPGRYLRVTILPFKTSKPAHSTFVNCISRNHTNPTEAFKTIEIVHLWLSWCTHSIRKYIEAFLRNIWSTCLSFPQQYRIKREKGGRQGRSSCVGFNIPNWIQLTVICDISMALLLKLHTVVLLPSYLLGARLVLPLIKISFLCQLSHLE